MVKSKKIVIGIAGFLVVALLATGAWVILSPTGLTFAQAPSPTAQPGQSTTAKGVYNTFFWNSLASRLGVTLDKLKQAFLGASSDTIDQAVKDGKLTQDEANQLKTQMQNRANQGDLPGFGFFGFRHGKDFGGFGFDRGFFGMGKDLSSFAKALNMTEADLMTELQSGKTIAAVAQEKNIDLAQVKTSVLADFKANLDQAVTAGKLTQSQADQIYNQFSSNFDTLVNQTWMMHRGWGRFPGGVAPTEPAPTGAAPTL
jgi:hypothetical protein